MVASVLVEVLGSRPDKGNIYGLVILLRRPWLEFFFGEISVFLIMCLTFERWFAVVRPIQYRCKFRKNRVYMYLFAILITALIMNINGLLLSYDPKSTLSKIVAVVDILLTLISHSLLLGQPIFIYGSISKWFQPFSNRTIQR